MWPFKKRKLIEFRENFMNDTTANFTGTRGNYTHLDFSNIRVSSIRSNVYYENFSFYKVHFNKVMLSKICFFGCSFTNCTFEDIETDLINKHLESNFRTIFEGCTFSYFNFTNCSITDVVFSKCKFIVGVFKKTVLRDVIFHRCSFACVKFKEGGILEHTSFLSPSGAFDIRFEKSGYPYQIDSASGVSMFNYRDKEHINSLQNTKLERRIAYMKVAASFYQFKQLLAENHISKTPVDYYYLYKKADTRSSLKFSRRLIGYLAEFIFGYGTAPFRALLSIIIMSGLYAPVYMLTGFSMGERSIQYTLDLSQLFVWNAAKAKDFFEALYFSFFTLCTVGQGSGIPISGLTKIISSSELFFGAVFITIFVSTLFKKITD